MKNVTKWGMGLIALCSVACAERPYEFCCDGKKDIQPMMPMKECPFCGSGALENIDAAKYGGPVICIRCGAKGPIRYGALEAFDAEEPCSDGIEAWDHRIR